MENLEKDLNIGNTEVRKEVIEKMKDILKGMYEYVSEYKEFNGFINSLDDEEIIKVINLSKLQESSNNLNNFTMKFENWVKTSVQSVEKEIEEELNCPFDLETKTELMNLGVKVSKNGDRLYQGTAYRYLKNNKFDRGLTDKINLLKTLEGFKYKIVGETYTVDKIVLSEEMKNEIVNKDGSNDTDSDNNLLMQEDNITLRKIEGKLIYTNFMFVMEYDIKTNNLTVINPLSNTHKTVDIITEVDLLEFMMEELTSWVGDGKDYSIRKIDLEFFAEIKSNL